MADDKKKKKSKSKAESATETEAPPTTPAPSRPTSKKAASSKKAKRAGSNVYEQFTEKQVAEFKEGFQFMDRDKDGAIGKSDIRTVADEVGKNFSESEIDEMISDAPGPINFTMLINMFGQRQQGGASDEDEVVIAAWKAFANEEGMIDAEKMKFDLIHFGEKYSDQEAADFMEQVTVDDNGKFACAEICDLMCGKVGDDDAPAE